MLNFTLIMQHLQSNLLGSLKLAARNEHHTCNISRYCTTETHRMNLKQYFDHDLFSIYSNLYLLPRVARRLTRSLVKSRSWKRHENSVPGRVECFAVSVEGVVFGNWYVFILSGTTRPLNIHDFFNNLLSYYTCKSI